MTEAGFHRIFVALFLAFVGLRFYWHGKARVWRKENSADEGKMILFLRVFVALPLFAVLTWYLFDPRVLAWADIPLRQWMRWTGVGLAVASTGLAAWVHRELGLNFSPQLRIRDHHQLVTSGPYRYVRHPMYTAFILLFVGYLLLTGNLFISGMGLVTLVLVMIFRTHKEERMMLERFGEEYRAYMDRTGRYVPRMAGARRSSVVATKSI